MTTENGSNTLSREVPDADKLILGTCSKVTTVGTKADGANVEVTVSGTIHIGEGGDTGA